MKTRPFLGGWGRADFKKRGIIHILRSRMLIALKQKDTYGTEGLSTPIGLEDDNEKHIFFM